MQIARLYRDAHRSFVEFASTLGADEWQTPSLCTPGWTVRDVLSHIAGVSIDIVEGNVEGAATDPWTALQVERWRDTPVDELLARWEDAIGPAADGIEFVGEVRPVFDCHTHEHDVRTAVGRPGNRDHEIVGVMAAGFSRSAVGRPIVIRTPGGDTIRMPGDGAPIELRGVTAFEFVRSRLGRRSAAQVRAWDWSAAPTDDELAAWFAFGPSEVPIDE